MPRLKKKSTRAERGVALLVVLSCLALVGSVVAEFQFNSRVDLQLALNARDEVQAEYDALSALRLRALLLRNSTLLNGLMGQLGQLGIMPPGMTLPISQILEMIPVECGLLSTIAHKAGATIDPKAPAEKFFPGECLATSKSEGTKIGLNSLANPSVLATASNPNSVVSRLALFLSNPSLRRHFEEDDKSGGHAESPLALIGNIIDWVDLNHTQFGNDVADEDRLYSHYKDSYKVKNAPFDSIDELQLVFGVDDELFAMLKDYVSVYVDSGAIELSVATIDQIIFGLMMLIRQGVDPVQVLGLPAMQQLLVAINQLKALGGPGFGVLTVSILTGLISQSALSAYLNTSQINQVFTDTPQTTWYTINAEGQVGNAKRRIRAVFQAIEPQFYYYRIE
jgi:hypothetical protein